MDSRRARDLYYRYRAAVAYVAVRTPVGDDQIGTAFHVGEGIWITARHVVEGNEILEIATTGYSIDSYAATLERTGGTLSGDWLSADGRYRLTDPPFLHPDADVDVAALRLDGPLSPFGPEPRPYPPRPGRPDTPVVPLGGWLDDWLGDELMLERVLVMGYPPIPSGREPLLVATTAEINTVLDRYDLRHPHFILSATARGGFSGALALVDFGPQHDTQAALGVTTQSVGRDFHPPELGYFAVLSVEPVYDCLEHHALLPAAQELPGVYGPAPNDSDASGSDEPPGSGTSGH